MAELHQALTQRVEVWRAAGYPRAAFGLMAADRDQETIDAFIGQCDSATLLLRSTGMALVRVRSKGQMTLPDGIRRKAHLGEGDYVEVSMQGDAIVLRPRKVIQASQAWFWDARWQEGEREASRDIAEGRSRRFESDEDFLKSLE